MYINERQGKKLPNKFLQNKNIYSVLSAWAKEFSIKKTAIATAINITSTVQDETWQKKGT